MNENVSQNVDAIVERPAKKINGFIALLLSLVLLVIAILSLVNFFQTGQGLKLFFFFFALVVSFIILCGLVIVHPNNSAVITFFGKYTGVIRESGIWMVTPFSSAKKSLTPCTQF